ncbi:MAG: hypothetical protein K0R48_1097 [Gammaproteobacteria bacterium]|nr:hypothetical protein [Gammaproteobacteria bacterium]
MRMLLYIYNDSTCVSSRRGNPLWLPSLGRHRGLPLRYFIPVHWYVYLISFILLFNLAFAATSTGRDDRTQVSLDNSSDNQAPIFMQTSVMPKTIYEGQAGLYTVKIFYNTSVREPALTIPDMDAAKLIHVGKDATHRTTVNGRNYQVLEQHYAVIAQKDGVFDLKSPLLQGFRLDLTSSDSFNSSWQPFHISAPPVSLKVDTIPGMAKSTWWLPSTKVSLTDSWSNNPPHFQSGVPVTRTLTLTAQNVTAEQLPTIAPSHNTGFQLYADKPVLNTDSNGFQLQASRIEKIAYLPNAVGVVTIPEIHIDWWNTDSNSPKKLTLPAYTVPIVAGANNPGDATPPPLSLHNDAIHAPKNLRSHWYQRPFVILSLLLTVAWIITLLLWWKASKPKERALHVVHNDAAIKNMRQRRHDLKKACQQNNAVDAKEALLSIGKELWPFETILSVGDLIEKFQQERTKQLLQELESVLYKEASVWHGVELWAVLDEELHTKAKNSTDPHSVLPHLYLEEKK